MENKIIIQCHDCGQKLRLPSYKNKTILVKCSNCNKSFELDFNLYRRKRILILVGLIIVTIGICGGGYYLAVGKISEVKASYDKKLLDYENKRSKNLIKLKNKHKTELKKYNISYRSIFHKRALLEYKAIWDSRKKRDNKYALTIREKALLEMQAISLDRERTIEDKIEKIARKASPNNSEIIVTSKIGGFMLDVNFNMSEMTSGESGSRTKHHDKKTLQNEVIKIISRVEKDVYTFCKDFRLESLRIGLKHGIVKKIGLKHKIEEVIILYKTSLKIQGNAIAELKENPFLDIYSNPKFRNIMIDEFPNIEISTHAD